MILKGGATSQSIYLEVLDSTSTTGGRKTGLVFNTAGLTAYYVRQGGSAVAITLATLAAANSAWASGGFKEVDSANMPGVYRLDIPDAAIAAAVATVVVTLRGATGMVQASKEITLTAVDLQDAVRAGLTAIPNAAAEAAGGLYTRGAGAGQIAQDANGRVSVNLVSILGTTLTETAGQIAAGFKKVFDVAAPVFTAASVNQTGDNFARIGAPVGASISADIAANKTVVDGIKVKTDQLVFTIANKVDSSIQAAGDLAQAAADKVWLTAARSLTTFGTLTADVADKFLGRNLAGGSDAGRTVRQSLRGGRNRTEVVAGVLTVYQEDDATPDWTGNVTTAPGNPITSIDPA